MAVFLLYKLENGILFDSDCIKRAKLLTAEASDAVFGIDLDLSVFADADCVHWAGSCTFTAFFANASVNDRLGLEHFEELVVTQQMHRIKSVG